MAGKKIGNAVTRNRVKRRIRAALDAVSLADGATYVVVASPTAVSVDFETLTADLKEAMEVEK
ncbi:MAG: ribonuclease P protein component [Acidimicrobiia bacterium]|nr:ribonuclease P protein component [Acidimicrobiia bacterium]